LYIKFLDRRRELNDSKHSLNLIIGRGNHRIFLFAAASIPSVLSSGYWGLLPRA